MLYQRKKERQKKNMCSEQDTRSKEFAQRKLLGRTTKKRVIQMTGEEYTTREIIFEIYNDYIKQVDDTFIAEEK